MQRVAAASLNEAEPSAAKKLRQELLAARQAPPKHRWSQVAVLNAPRRKGDSDVED